MFKDIILFYFSDSQDYDLVVIGGGSGGLACSKEGETEKKTICNGCIR